MGHATSRNRNVSDSRSNKRGSGETDTEMMDGVIPDIESGLGVRIRVAHLDYMQFTVSGGFVSELSIDQGFYLGSAVSTDFLSVHTHAVDTRQDIIE